LRTALFGGTFDPVHLAHLTVAREALDQFCLDEVLFVPASNPPHKTDIGAAYEDRVAMLELACSSEPRFRVSRIEEGAERSYTIRTLERVIPALAAGDRLYFLIGADAFSELHTWHRWQEVAATVEFIVVSRPGHQYAVPPEARLQRLETLALPVSSSDIREKLAGGEQPAELPEAVYQYIRRWGLYGTKRATLVG